jgi:hypothetical protein
MRNKKLHNLQEQAESASKALYAYLTYLDARETDPSYVHARMLFEEDWRLGIANIMTSEEPGNKNVWVLWYDGNEENPPEYFSAETNSDPKILQELGLAEPDTELPPSVGDVISFLVALTEEAAWDKHLAAMYAVPKTIIALIDAGKLSSGEEDG